MWMMRILWLALTVVAGIFEAVTVQLVSVWFALGALAAFVAAMCGASTLTQVIVFTLVSLVSLLVSRPFAKKLTRVKKTPTNSDRVIGQRGIVTVAIDNAASDGQIKVDGAVWSARSDDGSFLPVGTAVEIRSIEGVKLTVHAVA